MAREITEGSIPPLPHRDKPLVDLLSRLLAEPERIWAFDAHHLTAQLEIAEHQHPDIWQFDWCVNAVGRVNAGGRVLALSAGQTTALTFPPETRHGFSLKASAGGTTVWSLKIRSEGLDRACYALFPRVQKLGLGAHGLPRYFELLSRDSGRRPVSASSISILVNQILALWPRSDSGSRPAVETPPDEVLSQVRNLFLERIENPPSVAEMASKLDLSTRQFLRRFKAQFGSTPTEYATKIRLEVAREMILRPGSKMTIVAHRLGFAGLPEFSRWFKRACGKSPMAFQNDPGFL